MSNNQQRDFRVERDVPLPGQGPAYNEGAIMVDRTVPMPQFRTSTNKYPWRLMEVGTSFFVPGKTKAVFAAYCRDKGKKLNAVFRCEDATTNNVQGVRVWRVS